MVDVISTKQKIIMHSNGGGDGDWKDSRIRELENEVEDRRNVAIRLLAEINELREELEKLRTPSHSITPQVIGSVQHNGYENGHDGIDDTDDVEPRSQPLTKANSPDIADISKPWKTRASKKTAISGEVFDAEMVMNFKVRYVSKDQQTRKNLENAIRKNPMLGRLDVRQIRDIINSMELRHVKIGERIIEEGSEGDKLYISGSGSYEVLSKGKHLTSFGSWVVFGELALLYGCQRTATVIITEGSEKTDEALVWSTDRKTFQMTMMRTGMLRQQQNLRFIRNISFFSHLRAKEEELLRLVDALVEERYLPGEYIFRQGAIGETFYIVQEGELSVLQHDPSTPSTEEHLATLKEGDTFGERALQNDDVRTASIVAVSEVVLFVIGRRMFQRTIGLTQDKEGTSPSVPPARIYDDDTEAERELEQTATSHNDPGYENLAATDFKVLGRLGSGGFGRVDLVQRAGDPQTYALKCLSKKHIVQRKQQAHVFGERDIQKTVRHPFITRLYATYRDSCYLYMLLEPCLGGEMWCVLRQCGRLTEKEARFIAGCAVEAMAYLHRRHIVYRDLKPENLMLDSRGYCKLIDFGFAKRLIPPAHKTWTFCGTPEYMAPEVILNKGHSFSVDVWALGILIFELLSGWPPFASNDHMVTYNKVLGGFDKLPRFPADDFPPGAKSLVLRLCQLKPSDRLGAGVGESGVAAIRSHKWFSNFNWIGLREQNSEPPIVPQLSGPTDLTNFDQSDAKKDPHKVQVDISGWDEGF